MLWSEDRSTDARRFLHSRKAPLPIFVTLFSLGTLTKLAHPWKAEDPMLVNVPGKSMPVKLEQS